MAALGITMEAFGRNTGVLRRENNSSISNSQPPNANVDGFRLNTEEELIEFISKWYKEEQSEEWDKPKVCSTGTDGTCNEGDVDVIDESGRKHVGVVGDQCNAETASDLTRDYNEWGGGAVMTSARAVPYEIVDRVNRKLSTLQVKSRTGKAAISVGTNNPQENIERDIEEKEISNSSNVVGILPTSMGNAISKSYDKNEFRNGQITLRMTSNTRLDESGPSREAQCRRLHTDQEKRPG